MTVGPSQTGCPQAGQSNSKFTIDNELADFLANKVVLTETQK